MQECARLVAPTCFALWHFPAHLARVAARHRGFPGSRPFQSVAYGHSLSGGTFHTFTCATGTSTTPGSALISRARSLYAEDPSVLDLDASVYALHPTTIDLCLSSFDWSPFRSTMAAIKPHTLLDMRSAIPAFIHISDGKLHDVNVLDILLVEAGSFYIMDRGYRDSVRLYVIDQAGAFFVTRAKENMDARRVYLHPADRTSGIICDHRVMLNGLYSAENYADHLRRIRFHAPETGKNLVFLTNNTTLPALTIADLYNRGWQIELFFNWIKQHLSIKQFLATS